MPTSITIGEMPEEVRDELAARATVCGRTLEEYLRDELIALAQRPSAAVWMARVRARKDALQSQRSTEPCPVREEPASAPRASEGPEPQRDVG